MLRIRAACRSDNCRKVVAVGRVLAGGLSFCTACRSFGLSFGNLHLRLTPPELLRLETAVVGLARHHVPAMDGFRRFELTLEPARSAVLVYTDELLDLRELLSSGVRFLAERPPSRPTAQGASPETSIQ